MFAKDYKYSKNVYLNIYSLVKFYVDAFSKGLFRILLTGKNRYLFSQKKLCYKNFVIYFFLEISCTKSLQNIPPRSDIK